MSDTVSVEIRANVAGLTSGLKDAAGAVATSSQQMSASLSGASAASAVSVHGLQDALRDMKSEAVSTGRTARFFATDLAEIIPGAEGAKGALTALFAAGLSGSAFGVAVEGVKFIVEAFKELGAEEAKAADDAKKFAEASAAALAKLREEIEAGLLVMRGATSDEMKLRAAVLPLQEQQEQKERAIAAAKASVRDIAAITDADELAFAVQENARAQKRIEDLGAEKAKLDALVDANRELFEMKRREEAQHAENEIDPGVLLGDQQNRQRIADAARLAAAQKLNAEFAAINATREAENVIDISLGTRDLARVNKLHEEEDARDAAALSEREMLQDAENLVTFEGTNNDLLWEGAEALKDQAQALKDQKQQWRELTPVASAIGNAITRMAFDGKSLDDTLKDVARQLADAAIQFAIKALLTGGTGGAGGLLASIFSFEHGGDVPSAAAGWDVPSASGAIPAVLHPREMVLPEKYADVIRGAAAGGGGGGVTVQINGVIDGDHLMRVVHSRQFADAMKSAHRMGRIP